MSIIHVPNNEETAVSTGQFDFATEGGDTINTEGGDTLVFDGFSSKTVTVFHVPVDGSYITVSPPIETFNADVTRTYILVNENGDFLTNGTDTLSASIVGNAKTEVIHV